MATSTVRVGGGGNTFLSIATDNGVDRDIQLVASFSDQPGTVVSGPDQIHPVGYEHPLEIVTGYAQNAGTLTFQVWSVWGKDGWVEPFAELWDSVDDNRVYRNKDNFDGKEPTNLMGVLQAQRASGSFVIKKWELSANGKTVARVRSYHNCVITDIDGRENIDNKTLAMPITVTVMYTHSTVSKANSEERRFAATY